jgi:hypothetical protein
MVVENDEKMSKMAHKKNRRFVIFWCRFWSNLSEKWAIRIYRKTGPTKSTVLGPGPPPWENHKIYRNLPFFIDFGVFNRAGKSVSKIGIYALPPWKVNFMAFFNYSRLNLTVEPFFKNIFINDGFNISLPRHWNCLLICPFLRLGVILMP